jgi:acyl transferase domain-containing protein
MNFSGPSITLDTACSSSLTALYLACEAIQTGECSAAIVGGVNLDLHQGKFDINQAGGALSKDGVCRSFGRGANGYVAGEGVGALFLKPLDEAIRQGDNIHGVIKSIVVNHGGRTSGYTVPNPKAQTALVLSALEKGGVDARSVGYIEAHGTGTELGDPIEITGLTKAFQTHRVENGVCAIGSVKSNLGHLEAAAGVVSVSKVLLQMKHRRLVPSLHCAELNEFIEFDQSPFVVQRAQAEWCPKEVDGVTFPLRAGISSFGAGGSNAHVILESYTAPPRMPGESSSLRERVFPLSARNDEQLRQMASRLREFLQRDPSRGATNQDLDDIAYTLQIGRKSFDSRLAVIARTKAELVDRLGGFLEGRVAPEILAGGVKNATGITQMLNGAEKEEFVRLLRERRDPSGIARLWVEGLLADWQSFGPHGRRVSLPTYPFAVKRHWVWDLSTTTPLSAPTGVRVGLHPLIDSNESTFERQLFKKTFHSGDFFIHDHHVSGIPTLPGVAYLELVRVAGEMAAGRKVRKIRNILWLSPIAVRDSTPREVVIELKPAKEGAQFEVYSEDGAGTRTVHSQGKLVYVSGQEAAPAAEYIDIQGVRARCAPAIEGTEAYPLFKSFGLGLGPSFQVLKQVSKNDKETLGVLSLPASRRGDLQQMILHPSLVDGALQAGVAAQLRADEQGMVVPFSIGEVEILQPLQPDCLSYVTSAGDAGNEGSRVSRTQISILDSQGQILVRIRDSVGVPLREVHKQSSGAARSDEFSRLYYRHRWEKSPLPAVPTDCDDKPPVLLFATDEFLRRLYRERLKKAGAGEVPVILVQPGEGFEDLGEDSYRVNPGSLADFTQLLETLTRKQCAVERICFGWPLESEVRKRGRRDAAFLHDALQKGVYSLLFLCQALMKQSAPGNVQLLYVYASEEGDTPAHHEAVNGFAKALHLEHPRLRCKTLEFRQSKTAFDRMLDAVLVEFHPQARDTQTVRYVDQERYVRKLDAVNLGEESSTGGGVSLKDGGAYLITGGVGGLGLLFADFLARRHKARLILTGRSKISAAVESRLDELRKLGAQVLYLQADVSDREAVRMLLEDSRRQ